MSTATYNPVTMASGATDLINEAATAKITGEEERYSNTDFVVFQANVDGAMEVVNLLQPYLKQADPSLVSQINQQHQRREGDRPVQGHARLRQHRLRRVLTGPRPPAPALSAKVQAFAEALSKMSGQVS